MRLMTPLLLAGLAACSFTPGTLAGGGNGDRDGGVDGPDGMGMGMIDAPDAEVPMVDTDGDGDFDAVDNCPTIPNGDQRNHDGDPRGDACDKCPHLPSTTDADGDSDGIGDACDPRPSASGDVLVMWEGFYDTAGYDMWEGVGSWSVDVTNGVLRQTDNTVDTAYTYYPVTVARAAMTSSATITSIGVPSMNDQPTVAIYTGSAGFDQGYLCQVFQDTVNTAQAYGYWQAQGNDPDTANATMPWLGTFAVGSSFTFTDTHVNNMHNCSISQGAINASMSTIRGGTSGVIVLVTEFAAATFDYVFVVNAGS